MQTPNTDAHSGIADLASRYVDVESMEWQETPFDGVSAKILLQDSDGGVRTMLVRMEPGATIPDHEHTGLEQSYILEGSLEDHDGVCGPGQYVWRPPGNRSPTAEELAICQPFLERQIELIAPRILVLVGGIAAKALLNRREGITRLRGQWFPFSTPRLGSTIEATATFHPAYLLRTPSAKREVWRDLLAIEDKMKNGETAT
jgi:quercetin dioxygenase-like cupin family protein